MGMSSGGHTLVVYIVFTCILTKYTSFCDEQFGKMDTSSNPWALSTFNRVTRGTSTIKNALLTTANVTPATSDQRWSTTTENDKETFSNLLNSFSQSKKGIFRNPKITGTSRRQRLPTISKTQRTTTKSRTQRLRTTSKTQKISRKTRTQRLRTTSKTQKISRKSRTQRLRTTSKTQKITRKTRTHRLSTTFKTQKITRKTRTQRLSTTFKTQKITRKTRTQRLRTTSKTQKISRKSRTQRLRTTSKTQKITRKTRTHRLSTTFKTHRITINSRIKRLPTTFKTQGITTNSSAKKPITTSSRITQRTSRSQQSLITAHVTRTKTFSSQNSKETSTLQSVRTHSRSTYVKVVIVETSTEMPVPGGRFIYEYTVTNIDVIPRTYNVSAEVDNYMLNAWVTKPTFVLRPAKSHSGLINIHVDHKARPGLERKVKIRITDELGRSVELRRFIVIRENPISTDAKPPEIIILNSITTCKKGSKAKMSCGVGNWTVLFSVQDRESGLSIIDVDDHTISSVWTENYSETQVIRPINGKISTDCCRKRTVIIVTDNNGNTIRIPIYFPNNSSVITTKPLDHRAHSVKITAVVVSAFACVLFLVVVFTVTIQNWSKLKCIKRRKRRTKSIQLQKKTANIV